MSSDSSQVNGGLQSLVYVATADHCYTFRNLKFPLLRNGVVARVFSYERLFRTFFAPAATYIFTDFDRLSPTELESATRIFHRLREAGMRALNDPGQFLSRDVLLKKFHREGVNHFTCHLPSLGEWPAKYPVFLRTIAGHRGVLTELLHDDDSARASLEKAFSDGHPIRDLAFVEYAAEPLPDTGAFRKYAAFRIGESIIRANNVNDVTWVSKNGTKGLSTPAHFREERNEMDHFPHEEFVSRAFAIANLEFGRIDFGIVRGEPQAYEINTNPWMNFHLKHENPDRAATMSLLRSQILKNLIEIAAPFPRKPVSLKGCYKPSKAIWGTPQRL